MEITTNVPQENDDGFVVVTELQHKKQFENLIVSLRKKREKFLCGALFLGVLVSIPSPVLCLLYPSFTLHDTGVPASQYSDLYYMFSIYVQ